METTLTVESGERVEPAELVRRHQRGVWRYLRLLGCDASLADDLTQETFITLLRSDSFEQRHPAATAGYLRRVAHSLFLKVLRRDGRSSPLTQEILENAQAAETAWSDLHGMPGTDDEGEAIRAALRDCVESLAPRSRDAIDRRYQRQETGEQIAEALGIGHAALRVMLHRVRQTLRECVERKVTQQ